jgi:hypothetical protein
MARSATKWNKSAPSDALAYIASPRVLPILYAWCRQKVVCYAGERVELRSGQFVRPHGAKYPGTMAAFALTRPSEFKVETNGCATLNDPY